MHVFNPIFSKTHCDGETHVKEEEVIAVEEGQKSPAAIRVMHKCAERQ